MHITYSINQIYQWFYIANQPNLSSAFSKLENDIFMLLTSNSILCRNNQLKILYWCNCHPSTKVQTPALELLMPPKGQFFQYQHFIFSSFGLEKSLKCKLYVRIDFDLKNWKDGNDLTLLRINSGWMWPTHPGSMALAGMEFMTQCILLGPLLFTGWNFELIHINKTFSL